MALKTRGFSNASSLARHYVDHGSDFGSLGAADYEALADQFLGGAKPPHIQERRRANGDIVRFDFLTEAYGVIDGSGVIRTFFKPVPCASIADLVIRAAAKKAGRCHGYASNLLYFQMV
jgi:pyocin large subunit-like protein